MQNAKIKFQNATGFGVAILKKNVELTFVDKVNSYKRGQEVFATPFYLKKKLVCDVFSPNEKYVARVRMPHYKLFATVDFYIGEYKAVNGYPMYEKQMRLELKDCEVKDVFVITNPNTNYKYGYRECFVKLKHKPTQFVFDAELFTETEINNNHSIRDIEGIEGEIRCCQKSEREYEKNMLPIFQNMLENFTEDDCENMLMYYKGKLDVHSKEYSPNHSQKDVFETHLKREFFREELGIKL